MGRRSGSGHGDWKGGLVRLRRASSLSSSPGGLHPPGSPSTFAPFLPCTLQAAAEGLLATQDSPSSSPATKPSLRVKIRPSGTLRASWACSCPPGAAPLSSCQPHGAFNSLSFSHSHTQFAHKWGDKHIGSGMELLHSKGLMSPPRRGRPASFPVLYSLSS